MELVMSINIQHVSNCISSSSGLFYHYISYMVLIKIDKMSSAMLGIWSLYLLLRVHTFHKQIVTIYHIPNIVEDILSILMSTI
jgi:hypothetical protein